jgi:hypothetical protein
MSSKDSAFCITSSVRKAQWILPLIEVQVAKDPSLQWLLDKMYALAKSLAARADILTTDAQTDPRDLDELLRAKVDAGALDKSALDQVKIGG